MHQECYLLLCDGPPVTVRSQQIRALNLLFSLDSDQQLEGREIAVIGGGAAGATFAAGAASLGANVTLFEKTSQLLHMQLGCWHRPLHPEIFTWPKQTAYRPVAHLPILGWATGRAHDVADTLLAQFNGVREAIEPRDRLEVRCDSAVRVTPNNIVLPDGRPFQVVVLAVGFGVEENPFGTLLPWNSYWRVDPLDQTMLNDTAGAPTVAIVGSGDGALIEILRSCIQSFDQGALLDQVLHATLNDTRLRYKVEAIEDEDRCGPADRYDAYMDLESKAVEDALRPSLRNWKVHWLMREEYPFEGFSLPINRFIVTQIARINEGRGAKEEYRGVGRGILSGPVGSAGNIEVGRIGNMYCVKYDREGVSSLLLCDNAVIRYGPKRDEKHTSRRGLLSSVGHVIEAGGDREQILREIRLRRDEVDKEKSPHDRCREPQWSLVPDFAERLESMDPRRRRPHTDEGGRPKMPTLRARFVKGFAADPTRKPPDPVYRMLIWLENVPRYLRVIYDLHADTGRPISRIAFGDEHEMWINANRDYPIRARTNDGRERSFSSVADALEMTSEASAPDVEIDGAGPESDGAGPESFATAVDRLRRAREGWEQDRRS